jgi:hypothetical protein
LIPEGKHHENRFKIAAGRLRKLPPAATTAVLGTGRDLNPALEAKKWQLFMGKLCQTMGFRVSKHQTNPDLAKKHWYYHGQILVWYYLTKIYGHSILDY